ncbi:MAG: universal stress protein [Planctomycetales bacterium]
MKILLAVDGSPCSDIAIAEVSRLPWPGEITVQVTTVEAPVSPPRRPGTLPTAFDEIMEQFRAEAVDRLTAAVGRLQRLAPNLRVVPRLLEGLPKDAIVAEAASWGADLIVVGSHGYGPIRRFFLGSVSLFVAHHAPCSVLIARCRPDNCPLPGVPPTN